MRWPIALVIGMAFTLAVVLLWLMLRTGFGLPADVPNERSLHRHVVPRGGGIAIVLAALASFAVAWSLSLADTLVPWALLPFVTMALLGFADDRFGLRIILRLALQVVTASASAFMLLSGVGGLPWLAAWLALIVVAMVWTTNLFNFMDGMDGLAAGQAVLVLSVSALWLADAGGGAAALFAVLVAAASAGFACFNWHPARVFMGDAGSLSLGMLIAVLAVAGVVRYQLPVAAFLVLMGVFIADASVTLLRRMARRARWWQSHREHFYQRASTAGVDQRRIVAVIMVINLLLALLASLLVYTDTPAAVVLAVSVLLLAAPALWVERRSPAPAAESRG